jgi:Flp pilus assembly pilin Flp
MQNVANMILRFISESHRQRIRGLIEDHRGLTAVEYAVSASLIAVALVGAFVALGNNIGASIATVVAAMAG